MEINPNMKIGSLKGMIPTRPPAPASQPAAEDTSFAGTAALEGALGKVADARPEAIARARELINDPNYPSAAVVKTLSNFLATHLTSPQE